MILLHEWLEWEEEDWLAFSLNQTMTRDEGFLHCMPLTTLQQMRQFVKVEEEEGEEEVREEPA